mmetsp:Transcript_26608/g.76667  ORF Transcript_26608/g.76667 Transcript_26608/m.76667 type:complete len:305 (-) Transcript_26608:116-1030(-)
MCRLVCVDGLRCRPLHLVLVDRLVPTEGPPVMPVVRPIRELLGPALEGRVCAHAVGTTQEDLVEARPELPPPMLQHVSHGVLRVPISRIEATGDAEDQHRGRRCLVHTEAPTGLVLEKLVLTRDIAQQVQPLDDCVGIGFGVVPFHVFPMPKVHCLHDGVLVGVGIHQHCHLGGLLQEWVPLLPRTSEDGHLGAAEDTGVLRRSQVSPHRRRVRQSPGFLGNVVDVAAEVAADVEVVWPHRAGSADVDVAIGVKLARLEDQDDRPRVTRLLAQLHSDIHRRGLRQCQRPVELGVVLRHNGELKV